MNLSDDDLLQAYRNGKKVSLPYFDGAEVDLFFEDEEEFLYFSDALKEFLSLSAEERTNATPHVFAYF
jgi:hypothetical protein